MKYNFKRSVGDFILDYAFIWIMAAWIFLIIILLLVIQWPPQVPLCPEDAIYRGGGEFDGKHWDFLYCEVID
jgi:hypothetical protein